MQLAAGPEAFVVDEIPAYEPSGVGEHLYVVVRKRDCTTARLIDALAQACAVHQRDIGYAGRKDRHGITSQALSIRGGKAEDLAQLAQHLPPGATAEVLSHAAHRNKLRPGHLRGNRFRLQITGVQDAKALQQRLDSLAQQGICNSYGPQRYGRDGRNLTRALAVARGESRRPRQRQQRQYLADAAQAAVFDHIAQQRQERGLLRQALSGDVIMLSKGACFIAQADELAVINERIAQGECSVTAPLPGSQCLQAEDAALAEELAWCQAAGFAWELFEQAGPFASRGDRRAILIPFLEAPQVIPAVDESDTATLTFALGPGAYATSVLAQVGISCEQRR